MCALQDKKNSEKLQRGAAGCGEDREGLCCRWPSGSIGGSGAYSVCCRGAEGRAGGKGVAMTIECEQFAVAPDGSSQKLQFERLSMSFGQEGSVSLEQAAWWGLEPLFVRIFQSLLRESMTDTAIDRCLLRL